VKQTRVLIDGGLISSSQTSINPESLVNIGPVLSEIMWLEVDR